ncbi:hypothetical protein QUC31_013341 [Theobroma cacao]
MEVKRVKQKSPAWLERLRKLRLLTFVLWIFTDDVKKDCIAWLYHYKRKSMVFVGIFSKDPNLACSKGVFFNR